MSELNVRDTILYTCTGRLPHYTPSLKERMKREKPSGGNGKCKVTKVSSEEMERLWVK